MLSKKKLLMVDLAVSQAVSGMFAMFCNDKYRGESFKWSRFADIAVRHVLLDVELNILTNTPKRYHKQTLDYAERMTRYTAAHLATSAGYDKEDIS